jgi:hypothetical protein
MKKLYTTCRQLLGLVRAIAEDRVAAVLAGVEKGRKEEGTTGHTRKIMTEVTR